MMKTIWIIDHYSSEPRYGGISRQYDFALELSRLGYNVVVIASGFSHYNHAYIPGCEDSAFFVSEIAPNAHYVYLRTAAYAQNGGLGRIRSMFSFVHGVLKHYRQIAARFGAPDVVEGASVHPLTWVAAWRVARAYKVRFVAEVRDLWPEMWLLNREKSKYDPMVIFFGLLEKWAYKKADRIVYSMLYGDRYICDKLGFPREKVALIGQPLDCQRFDAFAQSKYDLLPEPVREFIRDGFLCVFTGYYMEYEGVYVMLEAMKLLKERGVDAKLLFLGSGQEEAGMKAYVRENGLDHVMIGGRVSKEPIPALLRRADVCLAHCAAKGSGESFKYGISKNKVNEYLYSDACVIYGRADENDPVAASGAGFVVKPFCPEAFADRIAQVAAMSREERARFGACGKQYIRENHATGILVQKLLKVLFD